MENYDSIAIANRGEAMEDIKKILRGYKGIVSVKYYNRENDFCMGFNGSMANKYLKDELFAEISLTLDFFADYLEIAKADTGKVVCRFHKEGFDFSAFKS